MIRKEIKCGQNHMIRAHYNDKYLVTKILTNSFIENKSVNYIIKQDEKRQQRVGLLMEYSFDICFLFGEIFLSDDKKGCALILYPDKKKPSLKSMVSDFKLATTCLGLGNLKKTMAREVKIKEILPAGLLYYVWFIGVDPSEQGKGTGTLLLKNVISEGLAKNRTICLETSTLKNIPWYEKQGFRIYHQLYFGYDLFCMKLSK